MTTLTAGWKLVPIEPTREMWAAVNKLDDEMAAGAYDGKGASIEQIWACLVDAAPAKPDAPLASMARAIFGDQLGGHMDAMVGTPTPPATIQDTPITVSLDADPRGVSVGVWQGAHCIYNGAHAVPVSAQDDAKDERQAFEAWSVRTNQGYDLTRNVSGKMTTYESNTTEHAYRGFFHGMNAPAAGDARDAKRLRRIAWLIGSIFVHGDFKAETGNERELEKLLRENGTFWDSLAQFDAAIAAQQGKGG